MTPRINRVSTRLTGDRAFSSSAPLVADYVLLCHGWTGHRPVYSVVMT